MIESLPAPSLNASYRVIKTIFAISLALAACSQSSAQAPSSKLSVQQVFEMRLITPGSSWSTVVQGVRTRYGIVFDRCVPHQGFQTIEFCFAGVNQPLRHDLTRNPVVADLRFDHLTVFVDQGTKPVVVKIGYLFDQNGPEVFSTLKRHIAALTGSPGVATQTKSYLHVGWRMESDNVVLVSVESGGKRRAEFQLMTEQFARSGFDRPVDAMFGPKH